MLKVGDEKVLIKPAEAEEKTATGILLPDTAKKKSTEGEVVAIGRGKTADGHTTEPFFKVGDIVIYSKYGGTELSYEGVDYVVMDWDSVLAAK
jgi:chaperonin GroES